MKVITKFKKLDIDHAQFYFSQVLLAFEYIHSNNMIYRDLKPENVLVSESGFVKLADFGFLKEMQKGTKTYTFCGTPEYIAPEIILNSGYNHSADWYAAGIFLYEMIYGKPPFMANDPYSLFEKSLYQKMKFSCDFDSASKSLIKKLTNHDLSERLGSLKDGVNDIKNHRYFKGFDFNSLLMRKIDVPYKPSDKTAFIETKMSEKFSYLDLPEHGQKDVYPAIKELKDPFLSMF